MLGEHEFVLQTQLLIVNGFWPLILRAKSAGLSLPLGNTVVPALAARFLALNLEVLRSLSLRAIKCLKVFYAQLRPLLAVVSLAFLETHMSRVGWCC